MRAKKTLAGRQFQLREGDHELEAFRPGAAAKSTALEIDLAQRPRIRRELSCTSFSVTTDVAESAEGKDARGTGVRPSLNWIRSANGKFGGGKRDFALAESQTVGLRDMETRRRWRSVN